MIIIIIDLTLYVYVYFFFITDLRYDYISSIHIAYSIKIDTCT